MELSVNGEERKRANLRVLQRCDKRIIDIIGLATHVFLYEFSTSENQWKKCNVEGSLFLAKRDEAPWFKMVVLNRNSTQNLEVEINTSFQMQLNEPYLIFRDAATYASGATARIRGLWFHDGNERNTIYSLLEKAVQDATQLEKQQPNSPIQQQHQQEHQSVKKNLYTRHHTETVSNTNDAAVALMNALSISQPQNHISSHNSSSLPESKIEKQSETKSSLPINVAPLAPEPTSTSNHLPNHNIVFDKKSLQLSLLSLIQDDRFLDLIHAQYLKVAHARANRNAKGNTRPNTKN